MARRKPSPQKLEALRQRGCLNRKPHAVDDELFATVEFFDPHDLLQLKYEMVRRVRIDGEGISQTARALGFSRPSVYQAVAAFESGGLPALLPRRPGPRRAHKLDDEVLSALRALLDEQPELRAADLVDVVRERFGLSVHPRSIERALSRQKKRR